MTTEQLPPRGIWLRCLQALEPEAVLGLTAELRRHLTIRHRRVPQTGLALLEMREPNYGERFNLGEIPVGVVELEITDASGDTHVGAAQAMTTDPALVEALALCDGVLANALPGAEQVAQLVCRGQAQVHELDRQRAGIMGRTAVTFDLLEEDNE
jgi:alpha-D-ribose 1-methylphosphonate 5-triphosphate synthase subunit PhnG